MVERKNLASFTPNNPAPAYISINTAGIDGSMVEVTVRSEGKPDGSTGDVGVIVMNRWQFDKIVREALAALEKPGSAS